MLPLEIVIDILELVATAGAILGLVITAYPRRHYGLWYAVTTVSVLVAVFCVWLKKIPGWPGDMAVSRLEAAGILFAAGGIAVLIGAVVSIPLAMWINSPLPPQRGNRKP